jgi:hypothetical protein
MNSSRGRTAVFVAYVLFATAVPAYAHDPELSGIRIEYRQNEIVVKLTTHISRLIRAEGQGKIELSPAELDQAVRRRLHIRFKDEDLILATAEVDGDDENDSVSWQIVVPAPNCSYATQPCEVLARFYPEDNYSRTVVSIVEGDKVVAESLLDADHPDLLRQVSVTKPWSVAVRFEVVVVMTIDARLLEYRGYFGAEQFYGRRCGLRRAVWGAGKGLVRKRFVQCERRKDRKCRKYDDEEQIPIITLSLS